MSKHGTILVIASVRRQMLTAALAEAELSPVREAAWPEAREAVERLLPAALVAEMPDEPALLQHLADYLDGRAPDSPYVPLIVIDPSGRVPGNALPLSLIDGEPRRLGARLQAALRIRALHATTLRRFADTPSPHTRLPDNDPLEDATVLLLGRGGSYPTLSVAFGERVGVVGALSIEAAARQLNARDIDGIVIGDGFTSRVVDAFLTVLTEDTRFRNLPVIVSSPLSRNYDLPNLEPIVAAPVDMAVNALPLIRQRAFEQRLLRTLRSIDAGGLLDPRTGLLTPEAFTRDLAATVLQVSARGAALCIARFALDNQPPRIRFDTARIIARLMRRTDLATLRDDGSIIAVFNGASLRTAGMIARRLASVIRHTMHGTRRDQRVDPRVTIEVLQPSDSAASLLARLDDSAHRAAG